MANVIPDKYTYTVITIPVSEVANITIHIPTSALKKHVTQAIAHLKVMEAATMERGTRGKNNRAKTKKEIRKVVKEVKETEGVKDLLNRKVYVGPDAPFKDNV